MGLEVACRRWLPLVSYGLGHEVFLFKIHFKSLIEENNMHMNKTESMRGEVGFLGSSDPLVARVWTVRRHPGYPLVPVFCFSNNKHSSSHLSDFQDKHFEISIRYSSDCKRVGRPQVEKLLTLPWNTFKCIKNIDLKIKKKKRERFSYFHDRGVLRKHLRKFREERIDKRRGM